ncbi:hypothetical protein LZ32DRAFT_517469, partial [Colletotrichum eremochloae]
FIVIDALDECDQQRLYELLEALDEIARQSKEIIKIFFSSRDDLDIVSTVSIAVPDSNIQEDTNTFIKEEVKRLTEKRLLIRVSLETDPALRKITIETLQNGACGMFRWVSASLEALTSCETRMDYEDALASLPPKLFDINQTIY